MFDPIDFLHLAKRLMPGDKASVRKSVSRAYYASFLMARDKIGLDLRVPAVHKKVTEEMYHRAPSIGHNLHLLRRTRNLADYDTKAILSSTDAKQALELAERTIGKIEALKPEQGG